MYNKYIIKVICICIQSNTIIVDNYRIFQNKAAFILEVYILSVVQTTYRVIEKSIGVRQINQTVRYDARRPPSPRCSDKSAISTVPAVHACCSLL